MLKSSLHVKPTKIIMEDLIDDPHGVSISRLVVSGGLHQNQPGDSLLLPIELPWDENANIQKFSRTSDDCA
jgi:hypothetical protein